MNKTQLNFAQVLQGQTLSKPEALWYFGNEGEIRNYFGGRKKEFTGKTAKTFKTTLNQYFETVDDTVKVGRGKGYKLGKARVEVAERVDNRGGKELDYTKYLDAVVLMALDNDVFSESDATLSKWVWNFGLANHAFYSLKNNLISENPNADAHQLRVSLKKENLISTASNTAEIEHFIQDFHEKETKLDTVLKKMKKDKLINYYEVPKVKIKYPVEIDKDGNKTIVKPESAPFVTQINTEAEKSITEKQRVLREKYRLTQYNVFAFTRKTEKQIEELMKQEDFTKDNIHYRLNQYDKELEYFYENEVIVTDTQGKKTQLPIEFFWFSHAISVKATKTRIKNYIKKNRPEFYEAYITDNEMFFGEVKDYYLETRRKELVRKAYKKAEKEREKIMEKNKTSFGKLDSESLRLLSYWDGKYQDNICAIDDRFPPDLKQGIKIHK